MHSDAVGAYKEGGGAGVLGPNILDQRNKYVEFLTFPVGAEPPPAKLNFLFTPLPRD